MLHHAHSISAGLPTAPDTAPFPVLHGLLESAKGIAPHPALREKALTALKKALALDENNAETHLLMADYLRFEGGWDDSENHFKKVVQLHPDLPEGHEAYAEYLDDLGRFEQGMKEHQRAQDLDPNGDHLSKSPLTPLAVRLEAKRKFILAGGGSGGDYWERGEMEFEMGQFAEALKDWDGVARSYGWTDLADACDRAYAKGGGQALIREVAKQFDEIARERWFLREMLIDVHRYAGDRDAALPWLETAFKEKDPVAFQVRSDPRWNPYRSDPRFQAFAYRVGLAP